MASSESELVAKLKAHVAAHFGGDYRAAFDAHDRDKDGVATLDEVKAFLMAAGVGNVLTRAAWGRAVIAKLDSDGDGRVSWAEFSAALNPPGPLTLDGMIRDVKPVSADPKEMDFDKPAG